MSMTLQSPLPMVRFPSTKDVAITVTNVNEAPTVTSSAAASFAENGSGTVYTAAATDPDAGASLTYSISGADASLFDINATTGVVTFKSSPNYEAPGDAGGNNVYDVKVTASDGTLSSTKDVAITVTNVNEGPTLTSAANASFAENGSGTVYTAAATDPDAGATLTYSISGADAALFNINATTGAVTFKSSPNYEAPGDTGGNNVYDVSVTASDGTNSTKDVAITVTNVNEAPTVTSAATASFAENGTGTVYTVAATDPDAGATLTYSISGADAALFNINATTGAVTFKSSPNYEAPGDAGGNNVYDVNVTASDGTNSATKAVAITVTNVNEAPTVTSAATASFAENATGTVYTAAATDPDAGATLTYSLTGADASLFNINATTGVVTFKSAPNYEAPGDAGGNNVYNITVGASDGTNTATKAVAVSVTNVNEAPTVTSAATASFAENGTGAVYTIAATDPDAGTTLTYSLTGADASLFNINSTTGVVTFKSAPNYEAPADAGGNNVYDIKVTGFRWYHCPPPRPLPSPSPTSMKRRRASPSRARCRFRKPLFRAVTLARPMIPARFSPLLRPLRPAILKATAWSTRWWALPPACSPSAATISRWLLAPSLTTKPRHPTTSQSAPRIQEARHSTRS